MKDVNPTRGESGGIYIYETGGKRTMISIPN